MDTIPADTASTAPVTTWISEDGQATLDVAGLTAADALATLLDQCADEEQRENIRAGRFVVTE